MFNADHITQQLKINPAFLPILEGLYKKWRLRTRVRILVVTDTEISTQPGSGFGVGSVIELIRSTSVGCMSFQVDIALRDGGAPTVVANPAPFAATYTGFRFDMMNGGSPVIDGYEQVWLFGFKPGNDAGPDANISLPASLPASDPELATLSDWMKRRKGGVFATGDHDYLGASMCHRIPRIGTMRRWTNADGVPPIGGFGDPDTADRIDTLRPPSPEYLPSWPGGPLPLGNTPHQGDLMPQPIEWVPWQVYHWGPFLYRSRPHPVLCHPTLGPIDTMPDHAHEGLCHDTGTVSLTGTYNFDGAGAQDEYPAATAGGARPEPTVIAYGATLGNPPYNFVKGPQPARARFPMISVYDGHLASVGRVATDSTWHHWFDINILAMKAENADHWAKISRYYINLAVWLSPPGFSTWCLWWCIVLSHLSATGFQEYSPRSSNVALGQAVLADLRRIYGPCWVSTVLIDLLAVINTRLIDKPHLPIPPECLTCPPFDYLEAALLGALVRETMPVAAQINRALASRTQALDLKSENIDEAMKSALRHGLQGVVKEWRENLARSEQRLKALVQG